MSCFKRYKYDPLFHELVHSLYRTIDDFNLSPDDVAAAVLLAFELVDKSKRDRDIHRYLNPRPPDPDKTHTPCITVDGQLVPVESDFRGSLLWTLHEGTSIRHDRPPHP